MIPFMPLRANAHRNPDNVSRCAGFLSGRMPLATLGRSVGDSPGKWDIERYRLDNGPVLGPLIRQFTPDKIRVVAEKDLQPLLHIVLQIGLHAHRVDGLQFRFPF